MRKLISKVLLAIGFTLAMLGLAWAQSAVLLPNGKQQFLDANGTPLAGGSVTYYVAPNTTTPKNTWQDASRSTLNSNPVVLDSSGEAVMYGVGAYRQIVKDAIGNVVWDAQTSGLGGSTYGGVSTGSANAQILSASDFANVDGSTVSWIAGFTNTGPTTINAGFGAASVVKQTSSGPAALSGGEIVAGSYYVAEWQSASSRFQLTNGTAFDISQKLPTIVNGRISWSATGGNVTATLLTAAGTAPTTANPVVMYTTLATGQLQHFLITASVTGTISGTCTLGTPATSKADVWAALVTDGNSYAMGFIYPTAPLSDRTGVTVVTSGGTCADPNIFYASALTGANKSVQLLGYAQLANGGGGSWTNTVYAAATATQSVQAALMPKVYTGVPVATTAATTVIATFPMSGSGPGSLYVVGGSEFKLILDRISTNGVSPLAVQNLCSGSIVSASSTLNAATIATANSTTAALLTNVTVAANTYSGIVDLVPNASGNVIWTATIYSSDNTVKVSSGTCAGGLSRASGITLGTAGGADTFDGGTVQGIAYY